MAREPRKAGQLEDGGWNPPREWEVPEGTVVLDFRRDNEGRRGTVLACYPMGHFADRWYTARVQWDSGYIEDPVNTVHLTREDGTQ